MTQEANRLIIAGGGLSGCLTALALARYRPDLHFEIVEGGSRFGGEHIWSFFDTDVETEARALVDPLIYASWNDYDVRFPRRSRTLETVYNSVTSDRLDQIVRRNLRPDQYRLDCAIRSVASDHLVLENGETIRGSAVIDARGPRDFSGLDLGWQKFVGREFRLERPHGLERPIIMDARVDQTDGYRFVYCLPFSENQLLVEDTYYSLSPGLDVETLAGRIQAYVAERSWVPVETVREEQGVLPVATGGNLDRLWSDQPAIARIGLSGGFFHPTTGYSFPDAVRTALLIARQRDFGASALHRLLKDEAARLWRKRRFYRRLNRMLFHAAEPDQRYKVLEHFYRLDPALIARFYAGGSGFADKVRILSGKPPVPVGSAIAALRRHGSQP